MLFSRQVLSHPLLSLLSNVPPRNTSSTSISDASQDDNAPWPPIVSPMERWNGAIYGFPFYASAISILPNEVLGLIFHFALPIHSVSTTENSAYYGELVRLRLVCRLWNHVIETTPTFWSLLTAHNYFVAQELVMKRSREVPLDIYAVFSHIPLQYRFLLQISPVLPRCRTFSIFVTSSLLHIISSIVALLPPTLASIEFQADDDRRVHLTKLFPSFTSGPVSPEAQLASTSITMPWLSRLQHFKLYRVDTSLVTLLTILSHTQGLRELSLYYVRIFDLTDQERLGYAPDDLDVVELPYLTWFTFTGGLRAVELLLPHITTTTLRYSAIDFPPISTQPPAQTFRIGPRAATAIAKFCGIAIGEMDALELLDDGFSCEAKSGARFLLQRPEMGFKSYYPVVAALPKEVIKPLVSLRVFTLQTGLSDAVRWMHDLFPDVKHISVPLLWCLRFDGLAKLRPRSSSSDGPDAVTCPLPRLETLEVVPATWTSSGPSTTTRVFWGDVPRILRRVINAAKPRQPDKDGVVAIKTFILHVASVVDVKSYALLEEVKRLIPNVSVALSQPVDECFIDQIH